MWVVKLGGSLWRSPLLRDWLERLARAEHAPVVVPGGGPFADQVRRAQAHWGFSDRAAHRMALLAMEQMALMLCALDDRLLAVEDPASIRRAIASRRVPVWLPSKMLEGDPQVAEDWTVTSDSLALWLAARLRADGVVLVKSADVPNEIADVEGLQRSGLLDEAFHCHAARLKCPIVLLHRAEGAALADALDGRLAMGRTLTRQAQVDPAPTQTIRGAS